MWKKLSDWMCHNSKAWFVMITLACFMVFIALVLPAQAFTAQAYSEEIGSPDTSFYYTANDLYQIAEKYGDSGRQEYVKARFTFDLIWPLVYTMFLGTSISWIFSKTGVSGNLWRRTNLMPVWGMLFDFLENISLSVVMIRYPKPTLVLDTIAPIFTFVKWIFVSGSFVVLLIGIVVGVVRWIKAQEGN
jgi:hypothetical protein